MSASDHVANLITNPFDDDKLHEECGIYGVFGIEGDAAPYVALGLHALQHRGQEAAGIVSYQPGLGGETGSFHVEKHLGIVRDNFTHAETLARVPGPSAIGHVRYSTAGSKGQTSLRDIQPLFAEFARGGFAVAHNGNLTNADALRRELIGAGAIFQSSSDTECILHLIARQLGKDIPDRMSKALINVEGAWSLIALTRTKMIGVRDPHGVRPLMLGRLGKAWILSSETCAFDIIGAEFVREVEPGEMVVIRQEGITSLRPFAPAPSRFCVFEQVYFSRPDSIIGGRSVYESRRQIGALLAEADDIEADIVCPVPDSGIPAAIGYSQASRLPYTLGITKNQYVGRTFIEPTKEIRENSVRLKLNANRSVVRGKRVVLVDDSLVRGTTSRKIGQMLYEAGASEVHFRIASPPTAWPCFYGVDTPDRSKLMAAQLSVEEMRAALGFTSLRFITIDGLYQACGFGKRDNAAPQLCDACFTGDYPVCPSDAVSSGKLVLNRKCGA